MTPQPVPSRSRIARPAAVVAALLAAFLASSARAAADVHVVEPGGTFPDVQSAIAAAADGDTILVRTGTYPGFVVDDRDLRIVADVGATPRVEEVDVLNLAPGRLVLLADLEIVSTKAWEPALGLAANLGAVRVQGCTIAGWDGGTWQESGSPGVVLDTNPDVVLVECAVRGGNGGGECNFDGIAPGGGGGAAVLSQGSSVAFYACTLTGGDGGGGGCCGGWGGDGLAIADWGVFAAGTEFRGGRGGDACDYIVANAGNGGDGLVVGTAARAELLDVETVEGGAGLNLGILRCCDGEPGTALVADGVVTQYSGSARRFYPAATLARAGEDLSVIVVGEPGDRVWMPYARRTGFLFVPAFRGIWLVPYPARMPVTPLGVIPASGFLQVDFPVPAVSGGAAEELLFAQGYVIDAADEPILAGPVHVLSIACAGALPDCDGSGTSDRCELLAGALSDADGSGVPDVCEHPLDVWHVDAAAAPGGDGSSGLPFQTLAEAFAVAVDLDTILVADGTYTGAGNRDLDFAGRGLVVRSANGPGACVIDLGGAGRAFLLQSGEPATARIEGLTIQNGSATLGGALVLNGSSPTVEDCVFEQCAATHGGALHATLGAPTLRACRFAENSSSGTGAGVAAFEAALRVESCTFEGNVAGTRGGGLWIQGWGVAPAPAIRRSRFLENSASVGGGLHLESPAAAPVTIEQSLFAANTAANGGGAALWGAAHVLDSTIVHNVATTSGGGLYVSNADALLANSIVWFDAAPSGASLFLAFATELTVLHSDVQIGPGFVFLHGTATLVNAGGNRVSDPQFVDGDGPDDDPTTAADNDYRLGAGSPCVDAGDGGAVPADVLDLDGDGNQLEPVPFDLSGAPRFVDDPAVVDTGAGPAPVVDMGALERQVP